MTMTRLLGRTGVGSHRPPEVVEGLNNGEYEVDEAPGERYSLRDLLEWAIYHGCFDGEP
jgi:hypothetical protein